MRLNLISCLAAVVPGLAMALGDGVLLESLPGIPVGWTHVQDADPSSIVRLRIALVQPGLAQFEEALYNVSTPGCPTYGKHLSAREVKKMLRPREDSVRAVLNWLDQSGVPSRMVETANDWINFYTTVRKANSMLNTSLGIYDHDHMEKIRSLSYYVPHEIAPHISMIAPIVRFGSSKGMRSQLIQSSTVLEQAKTPNAAVAPVTDVPSNVLDEASCNSSITPNCLRALYKIGSSMAKSTNSSLFGIAGFLEEYAKYDMLQKFTETYAPYANGINFSSVGVSGGANDQTDSIHNTSEANLDVQYGIAVSYNVPVVYYSTGGRGPLVPDQHEPDPSQDSNEPYLDFLDYMLKLDDSQLPQTLSISYGENEQSVPKAYNQKVCQMFGQLGARGVSVLFASGDFGPGKNCETNDRSNRTRFLPTFPAACPYVTSVGATRFVNPEYAAYFSAGGFSDLYSRPSYQDRAVSDYLSILGDKWKGLYNPSGRGFPDVAAQGKSFIIIDKGANVQVSGTSASTPVFAAIISLINDARIQSGLAPLGFLNPWLYGEARAGLNDIVYGGSTGCNGNTAASTVPYASWNATEGWDPVTGLGTPSFDRLLQLSTPGYVPSEIGSSQ